MRDVTAVTPTATANNLRRWDPASRDTEYLPALWVEAVSAIAGRAMPSVRFGDQVDALAALWREADAAAPGLTLGDFHASLVDPEAPDMLVAWWGHPGRGAKAYRPTEFLSWRQRGAA